MQQILSQYENFTTNIIFKSKKIAKKYWEREREGMKKHITITWERKQTPLAAMGDSESIIGDDYDNQETIMGSCD